MLFCIIVRFVDRTAGGDLEARSDRASMRWVLDLMDPLHRETDRLLTEELPPGA